MIRAIRFSRFGPPHEVAEIVNLPDPGPPGDGEVRVDVEASPINPADLLQFEGKYGAQPPLLPAYAGGEAVGIVREVGPGVSHLRPGDRVLLMLAARGNWRTSVKASAERLFALPQADPLQLAMLSVNPITAFLLLRNFVDLAPGDWVIQNAANSAVGRCVMTLAREQGVRTLNVVRRADLGLELKALGADEVLLDGPDLAQRVAAATTDANRPKLAFDAVAGDATLRLGQSIADGGVVVNYGMLSGQPCSFEPGDLVFHDKRLCGFWLAKWFRTATAEQLKDIYVTLVQRVASGALQMPVEATYALEDASAALAHAAREGRAGKVLFTPNARS